jgi:hypothetical protein
VTHRTTIAVDWIFQQFRNDNYTVTKLLAWMGSSLCSTLTPPPYILTYLYVLHTQPASKPALASLAGWSELALYAVRSLSRHDVTISLANYVTRNYVPYLVAREIQTGSYSNWRSSLEVLLWRAKGTDYAWREAWYARRVRPILEKMVRLRHTHTHTLGFAAVDARRQKKFRC